MKHIPSVLSKKSSVKDSHLCIRCNLYHTLRKVGSKDYLPTLLKWHRLNKRVRSAVVIGLETLKLPWLFRVRARVSCTYCITWETV